MFELFVPLLDRPGNFRSSFPLLELDAETLSHMVESYYSVDTDLCREIVGRKLTRHNFRKELEMLAERTHIQLPSVQRQVTTAHASLPPPSSTPGLCLQIENLRRISRVLGEDDREERGINLVEEIRSQFLLSSALAVKLARLIFLARYRFETLKKKLRPANLSDLLNVAGIIMDKWTVPKTHDLDHGASDAVCSAGALICVLVEFISDLRHLKVTLSNNKDLMDVYRLQVEQQLREIIESGRGNTDLLKMSTRISAIVKVLCVIGSALNRPKTLRNLFLDITEQVVRRLPSFYVA